MTVELDLHVMYMVTQGVPNLVMPIIEKKTLSFSYLISVFTQKMTNTILKFQ